MSFDHEIRMDALTLPAAFDFDPARHEYAGDCIVDRETGEGLALIDDPGLPFCIDSIQAAEWLLGKKMAIDAALLAIDAQRAAYQANLDAMARPLQAKRKFLAAVYEPQLAEWARTQLDGKSRTVRLPSGSVAFRRTPRSIQITDPDRAVEFAELWKPDEVRRSVNVTGLAEAMRVFAESNHVEPDVSAFAKVKEGGESVTIKTGMPGKEAQ